MFLSVSVLGCTWEFGAMVGYIKRANPQTQLIVVGFSLGGNIVCKFLGENKVNQERVLCCVSVCQGYCALRWVVFTSILYVLCWGPLFISLIALDVNMHTFHTFINIKTNFNDTRKYSSQRSGSVFCCLFSVVFYRLFVTYFPPKSVNTIDLHIVMYWHDCVNAQNKGLLVHRIMHP